MPYVYILKSIKDNKKYIGSSPDINRRLKQHNDGDVHSTKYRRPFILIAYQDCDTIQEASMLKKKYKRSQGALERAIKKGLVKLTRV